jgi:hypothetical protein
MARLNATEIQPGIVIWLDQAMLMAAPDVEETFPQRYGTVRPFVCLTADGVRSTWTPLTGTHRDERLPIEHRWRSGGAPAWQTSECYLNDGANTYSGPLASFVQASHAERTRPGGRARVSGDGLQAILNEVQQQHHRRKAG